MTNRISKRRASALIGVLALAGLAASPGRAADEPDLIFKRSTVFKWLTPNDKLATYGLDDPEVDGVACHFTVPEKGGLNGWIGVAEEVSDISLACRQIGPIRNYPPCKYDSACRCRSPVRSGRPRLADSTER
jgi:CreA protein